MSKLCLLLMLAVMLVMAGCQSAPRGDREFIPGQGWVPVK